MSKTSGAFFSVLAEGTENFSPFGRKSNKKLLNLIVFLLMEWAERAQREKFSDSEVLDRIFLF